MPDQRRAALQKKINVALQEQRRTQPFAGRQHDDAPRRTAHDRGLDRGRIVRHTVADRAERNDGQRRRLRLRAKTLRRACTS
jgi:hypothetical protein